MRVLTVVLILALSLGLFACNTEKPGADTTDPSPASSGVPEGSAETPDATTEKKEVTTVPDTVIESETVTEPGQPPVITETRVLFLGNSLMYYNDMPSTFGKLATAAGLKVTVDSVTEGSATIALFADRGTGIGATAYKKLTEEKWDYVVIEPSRRITPYEDTVLNSEIAGAKTISALATAAGAQTVIYSVWGNNDGTLKIYEATSASATKQISSVSVTHSEHTAYMRKSCELVAQAINCTIIADAGYAFENSMVKNPEINLYYTDLRHPSAEGSYLAACTVLSAIYGTNPIGNSYTSGLSGAKALQEIAKETVIDRKVPVIEVKPVDPDAKKYNVLVIGSNLMDNYSMLTVLGSIMKEADGVTLESASCLDSTFTFSMIAEETGDLGVRNMLDSRDWDAVILQLSRRITKSATDVIASETEALTKLMPKLLAETKNIFIFTLNSDANPAIFGLKDGVVNYSKTGNKESYTAAEGSTFFTAVAGQIASSLNCKVIPYGEAYHKLSPASKATVGYLQACCVYNAIFGKKIPDSVTVLNGLKAEEAAKVRAYAEELCLSK